MHYRQVQGLPSSSYLLAACLVSSVPAASRSATAEKDHADLRYVHISEIRYVTDAEQKVGPLKVGVLCLPSGSLKWSEVIRPSESEVREAIAARWAQEGTALRVADDTRKAARGTVSELRIVVEEVAFRLCIPGLQKLVGKPKLRGTVKIRWEMTGKRAASPATFSSTVAVNEPMDPRRSALPLLHALADGADQFSKAMVRQTRP